MRKIVAGYLSYLQMVGVGARVADGRLLGSLTSLQEPGGKHKVSFEKSLNIMAHPQEPQLFVSPWKEIFESYPMQKSVRKLLFKYCFLAADRGRSGMLILVILQLYHA